MLPMWFTDTPYKADDTYIHHIKNYQSRLVCMFITYRIFTATCNMWEYILIGSSVWEKIGETPGQIKKIHVADPYHTA